nr:methyl-accepting chemotaxis protein [Desulfovibrio ferrophilus]
MVIVFAAFTTFSVMETRRISTQQAHEMAKEMAGRYGNQVTGSLEKALDASLALAASFKSLTMHPEAVDRNLADTMIKEVTLSDDTFFGTQVVMEPNALDGRDADFAGQVEWYGAKGGYGPYFWRESGVLKAQDLIQYNPGETRAWYMGPRDAKAPIITEPYYTEVAKVNMATVSVPILRDGKFLGIVGIDFTLAEFQDMVDDIRPMETGYAFLASNKGYCVAHPESKLLGTNIAEAFPREYQSAIQDAISRGQSYSVEIVSPVSGKEYYYQFEPVEISGTSTPWSICIALPSEKINEAAHNFLIVSLIISGVAFVLMLAAVLLVARSVANPIGRLVGAAESIADGDFDSMPDDKGFGGELLTLHQALSSMVKSLVELIGTAEQKTQEAEEQTAAAGVALKEAEAAKAQAERAKREGMLQAAAQLEGIVEQVTSSSEELAAQIEESSRGTEVQRERTTESATAMEQMNASVLEVAQNASQAAVSADNARSNAEEGGEIVENVVASVNAVSATANEMVQNLNQLGEQAEGIGQIMTVITDIADQTNLLALNAAIEAARAGDAGRGFAVVADEVRKLAEKTMQATQEVGQAVHAIQDGTRRNIDEMGKAASEVSKTTEMAGKAGESLGVIVSIVESTADQVRAIATASEEQSAASEQISRGTEEINRIAAETADAMNQSAQAVSDLARLAADLRALIEELKSA